MPNSDAGEEPAKQYESEDELYYDEIVCMTTPQPATKLFTGDDDYGLKEFEKNFDNWLFMQKDMDTFTSVRKAAFLKSRVGGTAASILDQVDLKVDKEAYTRAGRS